MRLNLMIYTVFTLYILYTITIINKYDNLNHSLQKALNNTVKTCADPNGVDLHDL